MATIIAVYNSSGCVGRCDAKCYEAREPTCECICGGANHGAGYDRAVENTTAWMIEEAEATGNEQAATYLRTELDRFRRSHNLNGDKLDVAFGEKGAGALQPALF